MTNAVYVAWRTGDETSISWTPIGRLERHDGVYRFVYTRGARSAEDFPRLPGMSRLDEVYESDELFPVFANRLLSRSRPEYEAYLRWGGFDPADPPDPLAILGVTEGMRATDSIEVFPQPLLDSDGCFVSKFFLHGIRWCAPEAIERITRLEPDEPLALMSDWMNDADPRAVAVRTMDRYARHLIGYIPRYMATDFQHLMYRCGPDTVDVKVERVNHRAPLQMRLLCRIRACWPPDFRPYDDDLFRPIVETPEPTHHEPPRT